MNPLRNAVAADKGCRFQQFIDVDAGDHFLPPFMSGALFSELRPAAPVGAAPRFVFSHPL